MAVDMAVHMVGGALVGHTVEVVLVGHPNLEDHLNQAVRLNLVGQLNLAIHLSQEVHLSQAVHLRKEAHLNQEIHLKRVIHLKKLNPKNLAAHHLLKQVEQLHHLKIANLFLEVAEVQAIEAHLDQL